MCLLGLVNTLISLRQTTWYQSRSSMAISCRCHITTTANLCTTTKPFTSNPSLSPFFCSFFNFLNNQTPHCTTGPIRTVCFLLGTILALFGFVLALFITFRYYFSSVRHCSALFDIVWRCLLLLGTVLALFGTDGHFFTPFAAVLLCF